MTNVTPGGGLYRLGPHGLVFKKPVKLTLPVDPARIPDGCRRATCRPTTTTKRTAAGQARAPRGQPEHVLARPATSPTSSAPRWRCRITRSQHVDHDHHQGHEGRRSERRHHDHRAAAGRPSGAAQPALADRDTAGTKRGPARTRAQLQQRASTATAGLASAGTRAAGIEIDTRFGVPDSTTAASLRPTCSRAPMLVRNPDGTFRRRVEGRFDHIERKGNDPTDFHWELTDKPGTSSTYGPQANTGSTTRAAESAKHLPAGTLERVEGQVRQHDDGRDTQHDPFSTGAEPSRLETFDQIYPSRIDYTSGGPSQAPHTSVGVRARRRQNAPGRDHHRAPGIPGRHAPPPGRRSAWAFGTDRAVPSYVGAGVRVRIRRAPRRHLQQELPRRRGAALAIGRSPGDELYRHTFDYFKAPPTRRDVRAAERLGGQFQQGDGSPRSDDGLVHARPISWSAAVGSVGIGSARTSSQPAVSAGAATAVTDARPRPLGRRPADGLPDQMERGGHQLQHFAR